MSTCSGVPGWMPVDHAVVGDKGCTGHMPGRCLTAAHAGLIDTSLASCFFMTIQGQAYQKWLLPRALLTSKKTAAELLLLNTQCCLQPISPGIAIAAHARGPWQ